MNADSYILANDETCNYLEHYGIGEFVVIRILMALIRPWVRNAIMTCVFL